MVATRSSVLLLAALFAGQGLAQETVLLNFTSASCPPCRSMEPVLQRLAGEGHPIRHVDVMQERRLATRFQVTRTPTFVMVVNNREFARVVGATGYADLKDILSRARFTRSRRGPSHPIRIKPFRSILLRSITRPARSRTSLYPQIR